MISIGLMVALLAPLQDEGRIKTAWPKLSETWKAVDTHKKAADDFFDDAGLKLAVRLHDAFTTAGLCEPSLDYFSGGLKHVLRLRFDRAIGRGGHGDYDDFAVWTSRAAGLDGDANPGSLEGLVASARKLEQLRASGRDDEDNTADELSNFRKSMKAISISTDETPLWMRRRMTTLLRALLTGQPYPEPARASDELAKKIRGWVGELGSDGAEQRDTAGRELSRVGEEARPFVMEAAKSTDVEVAARARKLLGTGHQPWRDAPRQTSPTSKYGVYRVVRAPAAPPAVEEPADPIEAPKDR